MSLVTGNSLVVYCVGVLLTSRDLLMVLDLQIMS